MAGNVQVSSRITLDMGVLNMIDNARYDALAMTADATLTELRDRQVMRFDIGTLQNNKTFVDDSQKTTVSIVSEGPYARRLYFHPEYNYRRGDNASAGGKWFESFLNDDFIVSAYAKLMKQIGGL